MFMIVLVTGSTERSPGIRDSSHKFLDFRTELFVWGLMRAEFNHRHDGWWMRDYARGEKAQQALKRHVESEYF